MHFEILKYVSTSRHVDARDPNPLLTYRLSLQSRLAIISKLARRVRNHVLKGSGLVGKGSLLDVIST